MIQIDNEKYFEIKALSKSGMDQLAKSPAHYLAWLKQKPEQTPAMELGSAIHCAILEPSKFVDDYSYTNLDKRTKDYKKLIEDHPKKIFLSEEKYSLVLGIKSAVQNHPTVKKLFSHKEGFREQGILWMDRDEKVNCKAKIDYFDMSGVIVDLKTTEDASPSGFAQSIAKYNYHIQAAFYLDGLREQGIDAHKFYFVAVEKSSPYAVGVYELNELDIKQARFEYKELAKKYKQCELENKWPSYSEEIQTINLPNWRRIGD